MHHSALGPFHMTGKRTGPEEDKSQTKHTAKVKIESDSHGCEVKIEQFEDYDTLLSGHFDVLPSKVDDHVAESHSGLDSIGSTSGIAHQKSDKQLTTENSANPQSVQVDASLTSTQDVEVKAARQSKELFACSLCSYSVDKLSAIKKHSLSHSKKNPAFVKTPPFERGCAPVTEPNIVYTTRRYLLCTFCSYKTRRMGHLRRHILTHTGEKPFSCELCSFKATNKVGLNGHILNHRGEKPFLCELCAFKTSYKKNLRAHMLTHTGEKPYSCELCPYKTTQKGNLNKHCLTHTGDQPFSCNLCSYKATQVGHLTQHILIHSGEKPLSCELCSYKTNFKGNLKLHILSHTGEKPYSCELCSYKTIHTGNLNRHILTHS